MPIQQCQEDFLMLEEVEDLEEVAAGAAVVDQAEDLVDSQVEEVAEVILMQTRSAIIARCAATSKGTATN
jgi:hypothetical protein